MRKLTGAVFQSLDGVMQAPGGPEEDPTCGFRFGGWMFGCSDEAVGAVIGELFAEPFDLLLGRRTYDIFSAYWPYNRDNPIGAKFQFANKYVVTSSDQPLTWENSHCLSSIAEVASLKAGDGPDLIIQGSSTLYPQLLAAGLIDKVTLMTFPVILGEGKRLFGNGTGGGAMKMVDHQVTPGGTVVASYEPAGPIKVGSFAGAEPSEAEMVRREKIQRGAW